jgi:hypothetical protein
MESTNAPTRRHAVRRLLELSKRLHAEADQEFEPLPPTGTDPAVRVLHQARRDRPVAHLTLIR